MSAGSIFVWETLGTALLILLGTGVVANQVLRNTLGNGTGFLFVNFGWAFAVFTGASVAAKSGAHLNPAVTIGLATAGKTPWSDVPFYILGQFVGAIIGAMLCWAAYKLQFDAHDEPKNTLGIFSTGPTIRNYAWNLVTEIIGTFVLIAWILLSPGTKVVDGIPEFGNSALGYAGVAFVVLVIGTSLGGPTGYAINPARDLGPRIAYAFFMPIRNKGNADWAYSWVPVVGPIIGALLAALAFRALPV
jgi:glycerol uptake facilitator protein